MPYNPTETNQSGRILGQAMGQGLDSVLEGALKGDENRKRRKKAETILGALQPDLKDQLAERSLDELETLLDIATISRTREIQDREQQRADKRLGLEEAEGQRGEKRLALDEAEAGRRGRADERGVAAETRELGAVQAAGRPDPIAEMLDRGVGGGVLRADVQDRARTSTPADRYLQAGGGDARMLDQLLAMGVRDEAFVPSVVDLGEGRQAMTTSKKSAVPLTAPKVDKRGLQQLEVAGKKYFVGPGNRYFDAAGKPVDFGAKEDAVKVANRIQLQTQIAKLATAIAEDEAAMRSGDQLHGFWNLSSRKKRVAANRTELAEKERSLVALEGEDESPAAAATPAATTSAGDAPMPGLMSSDAFFQGL